MRGVHLFMILVALPALLSLGHDVWLFTENQDRGFMLSTPGYIWTHYEPESYKWTVENTDKETWAWINMILAEKSLVVGGVFAGFFYVILGILKILRVWPFKPEGGKFSRGRGDDIRGKKGGGMKYKRG